MNNKDYCHIKKIISHYLSANTRIIDLQCGNDYFSKWIKEENIGKLVSLSPKDLEHIEHENPFVAYNNFINDNRKIPTKNIADVVLLLGPLYTMENSNKRTAILSEIKRLVANNGKVITLSDNSNEKLSFNNAGFYVDKFSKINIEKNDINFQENNVDKYEKYYITVATPKSVITEYDVPPEVFIRIPEKSVEENNINIKDFSCLENDYNSDKETNNHTLFSFREVKTSIEPCLQTKQVKKSIDKSLQPKQYFSNNKYSNGVTLNLPILSQEISLTVNKVEKETTPDTTSTTEKTKVREIPKLPKIKIHPSIDKNLVVHSNKNKVKLPTVLPSIDKSLQSNCKKINPLFAKTKSKKKGANKLIK